MQFQKDESKWLPIELASHPVASTFILYSDEKGKVRMGKGTVGRLIDREVMVHVVYGYGRRCLSIE